MDLVLLGSFHKRLILRKRYIKSLSKTFVPLSVMLGILLIVLFVGFKIVDVKSFRESLWLHYCRVQS